MSIRGIRWTQLTLPGQFLLAGAVVMAIAMLVVGSWVSSRIETAVVQNSANSAAQYVESFISPIGQELAYSQQLSEKAKRALIEIFDETPLGDRIVSYKIWMPGGVIVHASNSEIVGQKFEPSKDLKIAWTGEVSASYESLDEAENVEEALLGIPLLEFYMPIREDWTGEIIAVAEFYEVAEELAHDLSSARWTSWLVVGATFLTSGMLLFGIVQAGGHKIRQQSDQLQAQLEMTRGISKQNADLRRRAVTASARATSKIEKTLRQLGSDLHDGPAQYLSLAALRMDSVIPDSDSGRDAANEIRHSLNVAMSEIRILSQGLALPDLDAQKIDMVIRQATESHRRRTHSNISLTIKGDLAPELGYAQKLCVFRFLQEALSNASRHAPDAAISVSCKIRSKEITVSVHDNGPGFDPTEALNFHAEGGEGADWPQRQSREHWRQPANKQQYPTRHNPGIVPAAARGMVRVKARIVIADDHPIFRDGLALSLEETSEFDVVGMGASAQEAVDLVMQHSPDLVLLDLSMPGGGIAAVSKIAAMDNPPRIAMLTVSEDDNDVADALSAGAIGYVLKGVSASELRRILSQIATGQTHVTPSLAAHVLSVLKRKKPAGHNPIDDLSKREEDILRRVAKGLSNKEVASELGIQEKTVKHYMTTIMGKLHARNRVEAALIGHEAWVER